MSGKIQDLIPRGVVRQLQKFLLLFKVLDQKLHENEKIRTPRGSAN